MSSELIRTKFFLRGKAGVESAWGPSTDSSEKSQIDESFGHPQADIIEVSKDGKYIALVNREAGEFSIRETESSEQTLQVSHPGIQGCYFSPKSSWFVTWERPQKDSTEGNLIVWNAQDGSIVVRYHQKVFSKRLWLSMQWSEDETICARMVNNEVHIYNGTNLELGIISKIIQPGVSLFSVAPGCAPYRIAAFTAEKKGRPACVKNYQFPNVEAPRASKSFYKAQDVDLKWSPSGDALIIQTSTDVDTSGKSYYGETGLYFQKSDGDYDCIIPLTKEGPVHSVEWSPEDGKGFIVLAGSMPCHATLYDQRAVPSFEFGAAPRNHVSWSPHGRFVCIAGFGNLAGDMDFWDRNKLKKMGTTNANSTTSFSWSPDSRSFATATTFPRLRVDNGYKIFTYFGSLICEESRDEIYEMKWRSAAPGVYPNRPQSPGRGSHKKGPASGFNDIATVPVKKTQAYRPPGVRSGNLAAMMRREQGVSKKLDKTKFTPSLAASGARRIPGMAPEEPTKVGNKARKKKAKEEAMAKKAALQATQDLLEAAPAKDEEPKVVAVELTPEEKQKKIKGLNKKLKQIAAIKERVAKGETLNPDQISKKEMEQSVLDEIKKLEA